MRAPVYRNIDSQNTLLGLAFPFELLAFLGGCVLFIQFLPPLLTLIATCSLYAAIRLATHGKPPRFIQHWLMRKLRSQTYGARLSAAARSSAPQFPYGPYLIRDVRLKRGGQ